MQPARDLFSYRKYWAHRFGPAPFLPTSRAEMDAERLLERQCWAAVLQLYDFADGTAIDRVIVRAERLRDNGWVEIVFAAVALTGGQLVLWGVTGPTGLFHGIQNADTTVLRFWYAGFALPLLQFLAMRWLWRWGIWTYILVRVARFPLRATATHPDQAAGLRS